MKLDHPLHFYNHKPMPRKLGVQYPGPVYHVMRREDRRDNIFLDVVDRQNPLKTLVETGFEIGCNSMKECI